MTETDIVEQPEVDEAEQAEEVVTDVTEGVAEDAGLVVEIGGDDEDEEGAPEWVKNVRRENRELKKRLKEIEVSKAQPEGVATLRPKPTLEGHDYDAASFEEDIAAWYEEKRADDARQKEVKAQQQKAQQRWETRLAYYDEAKEKLGVQDYDDAEATVSEILSAPFPGIMAADVRIGIIKQGAKDPAALVYALAKNPAKAQELAAIDDPVEFAWKASALEAGMKVTVRGKAPPPEKKVSGGVPGVAGVLDNTLERLRAEAEKTGDYTKVAKYKRTMKG